jgi:hypothetical protein
MAIGQFSGTLNNAGYTAPPNTTITWWHTSFPNTFITKPLNPAVSIFNHFDLLGRYGGNDQSLIGWQTLPAVSSEHGGGEIFAVVSALFQRNGLNREPTEAEWVDFGFANFPGVALVSPAMARNVLPDYDQPPNQEPNESGDLVACRAEVSTLKQEKAALQTQVTQLKQEKRLVIPLAIGKTLSEMLDWRDIPKPGGRLNRLRALVTWIRDEERKRQL